MKILSGGRAALIVVALCLALPAAAQAGFTLEVTGPADAPRMVFDSSITVQSVCLPVTNPAGGQSLLYGQRFADGPVSASTPAIVLVHGIASSTETWDLSPSWSVARALASAGYLVYSYDRLGYAASGDFSQPGGGYTLTTQAHRAMLHDVVGDVKNATYGTTGASDCSGPTTPGTLRSRRVVVIGHSAGGWIVAGYPGEYHDVAAMIEADISGSAGGSAQAPLGGNSQGGSFTPDPTHPDYFQFFGNSGDCYAFNTYSPGVVPYAAQIACTPPYLDSPYGEIADLPAKYAQDDAYIAQIGPSIPVLLTSGDHDTTDPPASAAADLAYYKAHCGCDVSQLILPDTAHLFMVHRSLPSWIDDVVNWLSAHGIAGAPGQTTGGEGSGRTHSTVRGSRCAAPSGRLGGRALGPVSLGMTRAQARRRLAHVVVTRNRMDDFCLAHGWGIRVGYASAPLASRLPASMRRSLSGRAILALTANRFYAWNGIRAGTMAAAVRLSRGRRSGFSLRIGRNTWWVLAGRSADGLLKLQRGRVQEVGIVDRALMATRALARRVLTSFPDA